MHNHPAIAAATLCLINRERAFGGLPKLRPNRRLGSIGRAQLALMRRWNYFGDGRPSGQSLMAIDAASHYPAHAAGQNVAWGARAGATPAAIVAAWMASPAHRAVLLSGAFREAGVAVTGSVPAVLGRARHPAIYALELGSRR